MYMFSLHLQFVFCSKFCIRSDGINLARLSKTFSLLYEVFGVQIPSGGCKGLKNR